MMMINLVRSFDHVVHGRQHDVLDLQQPLFHGAARLARGNGLVEVDLFHLAAVHGHDVQLAVELETVDALEALLEVRLDAGRIARLRQNLQHLVVRQEEKSDTQPRIGR